MMKRRIVVTGLGAVTPTPGGDFPATGRRHSSRDVTPRPRSISSTLRAAAIMLAPGRSSSPHHPDLSPQGISVDYRAYRDWPFPPPARLSTQTDCSIRKGQRAHRLRHFSLFGWKQGRALALRRGFPPPRIPRLAAPIFSVKSPAISLTNRSSMSCDVLKYPGFSWTDRPAPMPAPAAPTPSAMPPKPYRRRRC